MKMDVCILLHRRVNPRYGGVDTVRSSREDVGRVVEVMNN